MNLNLKRFKARLKSVNGQFTAAVQLQLTDARLQGDWLKYDTVVQTLTIDPTSQTAPGFAKSQAIPFVYDSQYNY